MLHRTGFVRLAIVGVLVAVVAGSIAWWISNYAEEPRLKLEVSDLDFGRVWEQDDFPWTITIRNTSQREIHITDLETTCNCLDIAPRSLTLPARGDIPVELKLRLSKFALAKTDEKGYRNWSTQIVPRIEGAVGRTPVWTIKGKVAAPLVLSHPLVRFPETIVRGGRVAEQTLLVTGRVPITELTTIHDRSQWSIVIDRSGSPEENRFSVKIRPNASALEIGSIQSTFTLVCLSSDKQKLFKKRVVVEGRVEHDVHADTPVLILGGRDAGTIASESLILRSVSATPFEVERIELSSVDLSVETLNKSSVNRTYRITQKIAQTGNREAMIRFHVRSEKYSSFVVELPVTSYGIKPTLQESTP